MGRSFRQSRWFSLVWLVPAILIGLALLVLAARSYRASDAGQGFLTDYPGYGTLPPSVPVGFPAWLAWQHALNAFFLLFILRAGWQVRTTKRIAAYWTRRNEAPFRTAGSPVTVSLELWQHLAFDTLWVVNGIAFFVLLFMTGQWQRIVPQSWDIFPNAVSAGIQYASLDWPHENGWINYNALQVLSYFVVVFIAAPLALITGLRVSPGFSARLVRFDRAFPVAGSRRMHFAVMVFFVAFIVVHVTLVFATGALANVNHMYAARDDQSWWGFAIFAASIVVMAAAWVGLRPITLRWLASLGGKVSR